MQVAAEVKLLEVSLQKAQSLLSKLPEDDPFTSNISQPLRLATETVTSLASSCLELQKTFEKMCKWLGYSKNAVLTTDGCFTKLHEFARTYDTSLKKLVAKRLKMGTPSKKLEDAVDGPRAADNNAVSMELEPEPAASKMTFRPTTISRQHSITR